MLRTRVLTALVLAPAALALIFWPSPTGFSIIVGAVLMVGCWEFRTLANIDPFPAGWILLAAQAGVFFVLAMNWTAWTANPLPPFVLACLAWVLMFLQLYFYRPDHKPDTVYRIRSSLSALGALTFCWMALTWLRHEPAGEWWILTLLLIIWATDIGAYFTGRAVGGPKMAPAISPGKTWAGLIGGLALASVVAVAAARLLPKVEAPYLAIAAIGIVTATASIGGDLFISLHKRTAGCKDTGGIFPGHGGILDRIDSLLAGAPFFVLGKLLLDL